MFVARNGITNNSKLCVVASLMATVLVDVGNASGFIFPLIAVHLFVFYFGLMADVTPPVVSRSAPNKTNKKIKSTETPIGIPNIAS